MHDSMFISRLAVGAVLAVTGMTPAAQPRATTRPGEEVMQPTKYGIRATPEIARSVARMFVRHAEPTRYLGLTEQQQNQMADAISRRCLESAHANGQQWQELIEGSIEGEINRYKDDTGRELARRYLGLTDEMRRLIKDVKEDSRDILTPEQFRSLEEGEKDIQREIEGIERNMKRWEKGESAENERDPFRAVPDPNQTEQQREQEAVEKKRLEIQRRADRLLVEFSTDRWFRFIAATAAFYGFTDEQQQQAKRIHAEHVERAQEVMTDEWKAKVRRNRMRSAALPIKKMAPYRFRLDEELRLLKEPIQRIEAEYRDKVMALATEQQRRDALAKIEEAARRLGVSPEEMKVLETLLLTPVAEK